MFGEEQAKGNDFSGLTSPNPHTASISLLEVLMALSTLS
jgi:hypothetical protein